MGLLDNQTQQDYYSGNDFGGYQFISLNDIINNFIVAYVGDGKIIPKAKRTDIAFHAQRAIQELSFDTFKSIKSQEITLPPSNTMVLPQDYVNYTRVLWTDSSGIKRPIYPTKHTQNPTPILQSSDGEYVIKATGSLTNNSDQIVLDGQYNDILVGMLITSGGNIEPFMLGGDVTVEDTDITNGITTITMSSNADATVASGQPFEFRNEDGTLILESTSSFIVEGLTIGLGSVIFHPSDATTVANVEEGMIISSDGVDPGTTVINVNYDDGQIFTSAPMNNPGLTPVDVTFISPNNNSTTWKNYSNTTANSSDASAYNYDTDIYDLNLGQRYGLEPSIAQSNGTYFIDTIRGLIHFSSNLTGRTIVLDYISDGLGTDEEMIVHKFAEEAMYKSIAYAIFSTTIAGQQLVPRFKKEKFAAIRQAKLRLSNLKIEELAQMMRGKSKFIKH